MHWFLNSKLCISTDPIDIKRIIIKECYEQFCAFQIDNPDEMDQSLERYNIPQLQKK